MKKTFLFKCFSIIFLTIVVFLYQKYVSEIGWAIARVLDYSAIDADGIFMPVIVHHIVMLLISLGILCVLSKRKRLNFKLTPKIDRSGIKYTVVFCAAMLAYYIVWYAVFGFALDSITEYEYELNAKNVLGTIVFQLLLSGTAEELMFRALPITCLHAVLDKKSRLTDGMVIMVTSFLFTLTHFNANIPVVNQYYSLLYVFIHGILYAVVYMKTNSAIYPMIMHGVSNFISVGGCYLYMLLSHSV